MKSQWNSGPKFFHKPTKGKQKKIKQMQQAIMVVTDPSEPRFLLNCLTALELLSPPFEVIPVRNSIFYNHHEMHALELQLELKIDEILLLTDKVIIKDNLFFEIIFNKLINKSCSINPDYLGWLGKYRLPIIKKIQLPLILSKKDSIKYNNPFHQSYLSFEKEYKCLFPELRNESVIESKYEKDYRVYENKFVKIFEEIGNPI